MKFQVTMKDPDTLHDAIRDAVVREVKTLGITDSEEIDALVAVRFAKANAACSKWFEYGEYLRVDIDTEAGTCTVVER